MLQQDLKTQQDQNHAAEELSPLFKPASEDAADFELTFKASEYGVAEKELTEEITVSGDVCTLKSTAARYEVKIFEV